MNQGVLPYVVEVIERAGTMTARAGLALVLEAMRALGVEASTRKHVRLRERESGYTEVEKIDALVLLLASGGECIDDINVLKADAGFCRLLGQGLPSADRLRNALYEFHNDDLIKAAQERREAGEVAYIPEENKALQGLAQVNVELVHRVSKEGKCLVATLDHDATIQESHKKEALPHYKGGRGYQPSVIYWAEQDLVIGDEYRDGNVPAGMSTLPLIRRGFASLPTWVTRYYFRADSACYADDTLKWLSNSEREGGPQGEIGFTISADMTGPLRRLCEAVAEEKWELVDERSCETVSCSDVVFVPGDWPKEAAPLRYVAVRIRQKQGRLFDAGYQTKYLAVVSNRWDIAAPELLRWHWKKAGTIEGVHDVTKNEIGARVPPCGRFGANAAWYRLSLLTYNIFSAMKSLVLPSHLSSARPKRLRYLVFTIAGRIVSHAGTLVLKIGAEAEKIAGIIGARKRLLALATAPPA